MKDELEAIFIGIDVACANRKRLPMCFARPVDGRLEPVQLPPDLMNLIPRGDGNIEVRRAKPFTCAANAVVAAIHTICENMGWNVARITIDAPAEPGKAGQRQCEAELIANGLSVFKTPNLDEWPGLLQKCREHLDNGGALARLPYGNKIWMRYGFELFSALRRSDFRVIEVYPFAIIRALLPKHPHKSTATGHGLQLNAIARETGWEPGELQGRLRAAVAGKPHDQVDAFMAAWVASLPTEKLRTYGDPDGPDAIWVPVPTSPNVLLQ